MTTTEIISISRLQKISGTQRVLEIDALTILSGQIAAIVGPVGSGKSELLALLTGQSQPTAGVVRVCGMEPGRQRRALSEQVGVMFREPGLYERHSARANLIFHANLRGIPAQRVDEVLTEVGLLDQADTPAGKLGLNLARRLAYGRAILHRPKALLLMEPFSGCDTASCELIGKSIRQQSGDGCAVLLFTREGVGLAGLCDHIYTLDQGRLSRVEVSHDEGRERLPFKIPARSEGQVVLLNPADLLYASANEDQTILHTIQGQQTPSHLTMGELEERLARNGFFRAHRGYLVNLQRVNAIIPYTRDSYTLILDDAAKTEIPLSKNAAKELRELLGY